MPSPLLGKIKANWGCSTAIGNQIDSISGKVLVAAGVLSLVAGQITSTNAIAFGGAYADALTIAHDPLSDLRFDQDFTLTFFIKPGPGVPANVFPLTKGQWSNNMELRVGIGSGNLTAQVGPGNAAGFAAPSLSGGLAASEWCWGAIRHVASTKTISLYAAKAQQGQPLRSVSGTYTGTTGRSTLPFRINGLSNSSGSVEGVDDIAVQELNFSNIALSDAEITALYNQGQGLLAPYTAYASDGAIPGLSTETRYVASGLPFSRSIAQVWKVAAQTDTTRTDAINLPYPVMNLQVGWINAVTASAGGEQITPANQGTMTITSAAIYVEGEAAAIPLTFNGGSSSVTIPYGGIVYCDPITNRMFFGNQNLRFTTFYTYSSGATVPGSIQFSGDGGRFGNTSDNSLSITTANFATDRGSYGFGPTLYRGKAVAPASYDMDVVMRGTSLTANTDTAHYKVGLNSGRSHQYLGVSGMSISTYASNPNTDVAGTTLTWAATVVYDETGANDARQGTRTGPQIVADKTTVWTRWLGTGSNARKLIVTTLYPITEAGNIAGAAASRKYWNDYLRGLTNAQAGAMTGRPCLVYQWNWSTSLWVATAGGRSGGTGQPLDVYVMDIAYITENNSVTSDNQWNTTVATNKVVISAGTISDGVHPIAVDCTSIAAIAQPQYNAALSAAVPAASSITNVVTGVSAVSIFGGFASANISVTVNGTGSFNSAFTASAASGSVVVNGDSSITITAPLAGTTTQTYNVTLTSVQDPSKTALIAVTVPASNAGGSGTTEGVLPMIGTDQKELSTDPAGTLLANNGAKGFVRVIQGKTALIYIGTTPPDANSAWYPVDAFYDEKNNIKATPFQYSLDAGALMYGKKADSKERVVVALVK